MIVSKPNQNKQGTNNIPEKRYVPLKTTQDVIIPSKVMVIENLRVIINDDLNENFQFSVDTKFGPVHNGIIPKVDISSREPIEFNEDTKLEHIKSIIRRCGILEKYKQTSNENTDYTTTEQEIYKTMAKIENNRKTIKDTYIKLENLILAFLFII